MNPLPGIIGILTLHPREKVRAGIDFKWRQDDGMLLWTNVFCRAWEVVFGRRAGIRPGAAVCIDNTKGEMKVVMRKFYTFESIFAHFEAEFRLACKVNPWLVPQIGLGFATVLLSVKLGQPSHLPLFAGAIAFGAANGSSSNITSSGSNIMIIGGITNIAGNIGTIQFNSVNANQIDTQNLAASFDTYLYMLKAQAATSTWQNANASNWNVYYYTGVAQNDTAGTVDNHGKTTATSTAVSGTLTPNSANCWVFAHTGANNTTGTIGSFVNFGNRVGQATPNSAPEDAGDSGNVASPSAQTQSATWSSSCKWAIIQVSMAPPASGPTNVKTWDAVAIASIKSFFGVSTGSVKSVDGIT